VVLVVVVVVVVGRGRFIRTEKEKNYLNFAAEKLLAENPQSVILLTWLCACLCIATFPLQNRKSFCPSFALNMLIYHSCCKRIHAR